MFAYVQYEGRRHWIWLWLWGNLGLVPAWGFLLIAWVNLSHKSNPSSKTGLIRHQIACRLERVYLRFNCNYRRKAVKCWLMCLTDMTTPLPQSISEHLAHLLKYIRLALPYWKDGLLDQVRKRHPNLPGPYANTRDSWFQMFFYVPTDGYSMLWSICCKTNSLSCTECLITYSWCH